MSLHHLIEYSHTLSEMSKRTGGIHPGILIELH